MIVPVRCFSCGKVLADKWVFYARECARLEQAAAVAKMRRRRKDGAGGDAEEDDGGDDDDDVSRAEIFDKLFLDRMCCRRHMLGHVDLMDKI